jgi:hypothetical protein
MYHHDDRIPTFPWTFVEILYKKRSMNGKQSRQKDCEENPDTCCCLFVVVYFRIFSNIAR